MKFLHPEFLWALLLLLIPVIIHLFNFRRFKKIYFSNIRFLKEVQQQTRNQNRIRHILILLSRILALGFIIVAFARPYQPELSNDAVKGKSAISIYIDNSFSMEAMGTGGPLFDLACEQAIALAESFQESDRYQLITNDMEGFRDRFVSRNEFIRQVRELNTSPAARDISAIINRQHDLLKATEMPVKKAYVLSDFQRSVTYTSDFPEDKSIQHLLIPLHAESTDNLWIDSVWFDQPVRQLGAQERLHVRVRNSTTENIENLRLTLDVNGSTKIGNANLPAEGEGTAIIGFTNQDKGEYSCRLWLEAGDIQPEFDDTMHLAYSVREHVSILILNEGNPDEDAVSGVFVNDGFYRLTRSDHRQFDPSIINDFDMVVINGINSPGTGLASTLRTFADNGGSVFLYPGSQSSLSAWNTLCRELSITGFTQTDTAMIQVIRLNATHPLFDGVLEKENEIITLPKVRYRLTSARSVSSGEDVILSLRGGGSFLSSFQVGKGTIYRCISPADEKGGSFVRHAFFVTTLIRAAEMSARSTPLYLTIGKENSLVIKKPSKNLDAQYEIVRLGNGQRFIPLTTQSKRGVTTLMLYTGNQELMNRAGIMSTQLQGEELFRFGLNYNRKESKLERIAPDELREALADDDKKGYEVTDAVSTSEHVATLAQLKSGELWKLCLIFALIFLAAETLLLRLWKV